MKVGDILKEEVNNTPGLQYPCKIKINKNFIYPGQQKLENTIFLENCNTFLNNCRINKSNTTRHRSYSQKKTLKSTQSSVKKLFLKKNSENYSKNAITKLFDSLPSLLVDSSPKTERNAIINNKKPSLFNESLVKKNNNLNLKSEYTFSLSNKKREIIPSLKEKKVNNQIKMDNLFNTNSKKKANSLNKNRNIFEIRINNKMQIMNHIINKLNTPIFIYNKTEINQ